MSLSKIPLLLRVLIAILLGISVGLFSAPWFDSLMMTLNMLFSHFLGFIVPLLILGLVAPGIADLGRGSGPLLAITALIAYGFTLFSGFFTYISCINIYPHLIGQASSMELLDATQAVVKPYFIIEMPPLMGVMTALILAFTLGLGMSIIKGNALKSLMNDFRDIIILVIEKLIIPLLPFYIFGVFVLITSNGEIAGVIGMFAKIIVLIFALTLLLLLIQFSLAGLIAHRNPLTMLRSMIPAYLTALGTQSSAATIPVTLAQSLKNGVNPKLGSFVIPLCATIHLSGSTLKIVACAMAIMMARGLPLDLMQLGGFIMMLGIAMVAAPGVPGGAIMAAQGLLASMLGFDESAIALMIALYIAMDSFGTACNVTGDCAIAVIINKIAKRLSTKETE